MRCPRCKQVFAPIVDAEVDESESVAVVLDEPLDPDRSFFQNLAEADDPFAPQPSRPVAEAKPVAEAEPKPKPAKRPAPSNPAPRNGMAVAFVALIGLVLVGGIAGASYVVYKVLTRDRLKDLVESPPDGRIPDDVLAKVRAATGHVRTTFPDGQVTSSGGFFVPGPGLVLTNARSVGQGRKTVPASKIAFTCGSRTLAARILGADAELDLALLQVAGFDLPEPLPLTADTFTVREPMPIVVFSVSEAKEVAEVYANASGTRELSGSSRPWILIGGTLPPGTWGGPVTDTTGRTIGVSGVIPGMETAAAIPVETALSFIQKAVKGAEATGGIAFAPPGSGKAQPGDGFDDTFPGLPNPWRQGRPDFPRGWDGPPPLPPWNQPILPPNFPRPKQR